MMRIVAGLVGMALAGSLAACGSSTTNEVALNDALANETVLNDELPVDENATLTNGDVLLDNGATDTLLTPTDNTL